MIAKASLQPRLKHILKSFLGNIEKNKLSCFSQKHLSVTSKIKVSYEVAKDLQETLTYQRQHQRCCHSSYITWKNMEWYTEKLFRISPKNIILPYRIWAEHCSGIGRHVSLGRRFFRRTGYSDTLPQGTPALFCFLPFGFSPSRRYSAHQQALFPAFPPALPVSVSTLLTPPTSSARSRTAILGHCLPRCPVLWNNPRASEAWGICQGLFWADSITET